MSKLICDLVRFGTFQTWFQPEECKRAILHQCFPKYVETDA